MGMLKDLLANRKANSAPKSTQATVDEADGEVKLYNRVWLNKMSNKFGFIVSDNDKKVDGILAALNRRDGHCPCGGNGVQYICPCAIMRETGICKCGLFNNITPVEPTGSSSGRIK